MSAAMVRVSTVDPVDARECAPDRGEPSSIPAIIAMTISM